MDENAENVVKLHETFHGTHRIDQHPVFKMQLWSHPTATKVHKMQMKEVQVEVGGIVEASTQKQALGASVHCKF